MKRANLTLFLSTIALVFIGCGNDCDCSFLVSNKLSDSLFIEKYCTSRGGVLANDTYTTYITDSATFRFELGNVGDHDQLDVKLEDKKVVVQTIEPFNTTVVDKEEIFSIDELKLKYDYKEPNEIKLPLTGERLVEENSTWNDADVKKFDCGLYSEDIVYTIARAKNQKFIHAIYITDSLTFRVFACNYDIDQWTKGLDLYELRIRNNNLNIINYHTVHNSRVLNETKYDLREIKAKGKYKPVCNK